MNTMPNSRLDSDVENLRPSVASGKGSCPREQPVQLEDDEDPKNWMATKKCKIDSSDAASSLTP